MSAALSALTEIRPLPPLARPLFSPESVAPELRELPRWCVVQCVGRSDGSVKKTLLITGRQPRRSNGWLAKSDDPATWSTFDEAVADARLRNLAIAMSFDRETGLFFLDVDSAFGEDDQLVPGAVELIERFNTRVDRTVSGRGLRIIGIGQLPERAPKLRPDGACVVEPFPVGGPQWALISGIALPGYETVRDCSDVISSLAPAPRPKAKTARQRKAKTVDEPVPIVPTTLSEEELHELVSAVAPFWVQGKRNSLALGLSGYLIQQGVPSEQIIGIFEALAVDDEERRSAVGKARRTIEKHEAGDTIVGWTGLQEAELPDETLRTLEKIGTAVWRAAHLHADITPTGEPTDLFMGLSDGGSAEPILGAAPDIAQDSDTATVAGPNSHTALAGPEAPADVCLEDFLAHLEAHKYLCRPTGGMWPAASVDAVVPPIVLGVDRTTGELITQKASRWLDKHAAVHQITWLPGAPEILEGRVLNHGGWVERPGYRAYNTYRPPTITPGDASRAGPWLEHVHTLYPDEAPHLIAWFAHRVQRPAEKINHGLLLGGMQGVGKDTILRPVREAIGEWNFHVASPPQIMGRFNNFVKSVILLIPELYDAGEVDRFAFYEHMKPMLAAPPDMHRCDEKYLPEQQVPNVVGCVITSNQRIGLHLPAGDRRHFAAWSEANPADRETFPVGYFDELHHWFDHEGGHGHVAAYLQQLDLSTFSPTAPPAKTRWFWAIVDAARPMEEAELAAALDHLGGPPGGEATWPLAITIRDAVAASRRLGNSNFAEWLEERKNRKAIPHRLEGCGYVAVRNPDARSGWWVVGKERVAIYARRTLNHRDQLIAANERRGRGSS